MYCTREKGIARINYKALRPKKEEKRLREHYLSILLRGFFSFRWP